MNKLIKKDVEVVRKSITALTQILAEKKIRVTQQGEDAFVESRDGVPVRINIPYIPDNISETLLAAINGFLDHEVAHVLYTDFNATIRHKIPPNSGIYQLYNILEDARIELRMQEKFKGSKTNLTKVGNFVLDSVWKPGFDAAMKEGSEERIFLALLGPALRAMAGQEMFANFMEDKWVHISSTIEKLSPLKSRIAKMQSTDEVCAIAKEMAKILSQKDEPKKDEEGDGENSKKDKS
jgi:hypothetical protein